MALSMNVTERHHLFDDWAAGYDRQLAAAAHEFPLDGYERILDELVEQAAVTPGMRVLDLGTGTGNLAARFVAHGCQVWALDFSSGMLAQTRRKLPGVHLVQANLLDEWPIGLQHSFDRIVSAYVFHEFDLGTKLRLLQRVALRHLESDGRILIADVAFATTAARERARHKWADLWDDEEHYWAADETAAAATELELLIQFRQLSSCGGIFTVTVQEERELGSKS
jgi:putative AdoMet-dependent methyltransferase